MQVTPLAKGATQFDLLGGLLGPSNLAPPTIALRLLCDCISRRLAVRWWRPSKLLEAGILGFSIGGLTRGTGSDE
jgi:hypothetical protein